MTICDWMTYNISLLHPQFHLVLLLYSHESFPNLSSDSQFIGGRDRIQYPLYTTLD